IGKVLLFARREVAHFDLDPDKGLPGRAGSYAGQPARVLAVVVIVGACCVANAVDQTIGDSDVVGLAFARTVVEGVVGPRAYIADAFFRRDLRAATGCAGWIQVGD